MVRRKRGGRGQRDRMCEDNTLHTCTWDVISGKTREERESERAREERESERARAGKREGESDPMCDDNTLRTWVVTSGKTREREREIPCVEITHCAYGMSSVVRRERERERERVRERERESERERVRKGE